MKKYNCIVVFNRNKDHVLFCKRMKEPYQGLYNLVGGKVEAGEGDEDAAYRELREETGIGRSQIRLFHFMDLTYYYQNFVLELYVGQLGSEMQLVPEINPLEWLSLDEDFTDRNRFAGEQNIAHIINVALKYPLDKYRIRCLPEGICIGIDGCRGGWIAAVLDHGNMRIKKYFSIARIIEEYPVFDSCLIDMAIGLPSSVSDQRPDGVAKKMLGQRASTIFPIPFRQAVYEDTEEKQKAANMKIMGKSLAKQTTAIIPKIRELDEFLDCHKEYQNGIKESHPEVCFSRLYGEVILSRKSEFMGLTDRLNVLSYYQDGLENLRLWDMAKELGCRQDDIVDAVCLAVTANLDMQGKTENIPENPQEDQKGLLMRMVIPKERYRNHGMNAEGVTGYKMNW